VSSAPRGPQCGDRGVARRASPACLEHPASARQQALATGQSTRRQDRYNGSLMRARAASESRRGAGENEQQQRSPRVARNKDDARRSQQPSIGTGSASSTPARPGRRGRGDIGRRRAARHREVQSPKPRQVEQALRARKSARHRSRSGINQRSQSRSSASAIGAAASWTHASGNRAIEMDSARRPPQHRPRARRHAPRTKRSRV